MKKFQTNKPMTHHLHVEIFTVLRENYAAFISPEKIPVLSAKALSDLDIENVDKHLPLTKRYVGADAHQALSILKKDRIKHSWIEGFFTSLKSAYIAGRKKLKSLPLLNRTLIRLSAFSPDLQ